MTEFPTNPTRFDPYKTSNSREMGWPIHPCNFTHNSAHPHHGVVEHREGGDPSTSRKSTGLNQFGPITLERGLTDDTAFEDWANLVWKYGRGTGSEVSLNEFRKDIYLEFYNEAGSWFARTRSIAAGPRSIRRFPIWTPTPTAVAIEHIKLENEGWERDTSVVPPPQP